MSIQLLVSSIVGMPGYEAFHPWYPWTCVLELRNVCPKIAFPNRNQWKITYYTYTYKHTYIYIYIYTDNESLDFWFLALKHTHEPNLSPPPNLRTPLLLSVDARFGTRWRAAGCYVKWGRSWAPQVVWVKYGRYGWMYWLLLVSSQNGSHLTS